MAAADADERDAGSQPRKGGTDCCGVAAGVFGVMAVIAAVAPALLLRSRRSR